MRRIPARRIWIALRESMRLDWLARARHDVLVGLAWRSIGAAAQASLIPLDAVERRAEDGRALVCNGALGGLLLHGDAGGADCGPDRRHRQGAAVRRSGREVRAAEAEAHLFKGDTEHVGRDL